MTLWCKRYCVFSKIK